MDFPTQLLQKYSGALPRYTSYPTAIELSDCTNDIQIHQLLENTLEHPVSLYVHLPYCSSLCYFCACNKIIDPEPTRRDEYLSLLEQESSILTSFSAAPIPLAQLHLGGGSPSLLTPDQLSDIMRLLRSSFSFTDCKELSVEIDPRTFTPEKASVLVDNGFNRMSLGVQDFDAEVQKIVNRIQPFDLTASCVETLRAHDIGSINFDLIYGLPGQTVERFSKTIDQVCKLRPERIALYGYAHVRWKVKVQNVFRKHGIPGAEDRLALFECALNILEREGYVHIGLDHFALPEDELFIAQSQGRLRRNFMGYTTVEGSGVLGLGVSAISDLGGILFQNSPDLSLYASRLSEKKLPVSKIFVRSKEDSIRAYCIERLMCDGKLYLHTVCEHFPEHTGLCAQILDSALQNLSSLQEDDLVQCTANSIQVTETGRLFLRHIAASFDTYLAATQQSSQPVFSQSL